MEVDDAARIAEDLADDVLSESEAQDGEMCFYCQVMPADTVDHVIPRVIRAKLEGFMEPLEYATFMARFPDVVPACADCNFRKGTKVFHTVRSIRYAIAEALAKKHKRLLAAPNWTPAEIENLGPALRYDVEKAEARKRLVRARISHLRR